MQKIINTLQQFGLSFDSLIADKQIHRCNSSSKDRKNKDGWYIISEWKNNYYCYYGCWVKGEQGKCSTLNNNVNKYEQTAAWKELEAERLKSEKMRIEASRLKAFNFISKCSISNDKHPYLEKKQINSCGCLINEKYLIIPIYDDRGGVSSFQSIDNQGTKKFMPDGIVGGCFFTIQGVENTICICEGFATGASIHQSTGYKTLVAFNAGNLKKVAAAAKNKFKNSDIIICADNDYTKEKNVGLVTGKMVADSLDLLCVWPTEIKGSDFNDMACELGINTVRQEINRKETIEVLSQKDCIGQDNSLQIPNSAIPQGLILQGVEALDDGILQFSLPLVLTTISRAISGKISLNGVYPNVYNVKVGGTSTGKTSTDKKFLRHLDIDNFISVNDVASGPGLWRIVAENPLGMGMFDEITSIFQRNNLKGGVDMIAEGKVAAFMEIYSRSGESFIKGFGDIKNKLVVNNLCFSLIGNATPTIFDAIQLKDFETGLMQRFDFWVYDGKIKPKSLFIDNNYSLKIKVFIDKLKKITELPLPDEKLTTLIKGCIDLGATPNAINCLREYSEHITIEGNKQQTGGLVGFISRKFDLCLKYALIHHVSSEEIKNIFQDVNKIDIQYGILIAEMLGGWKSHVLSDKVVSGDFHKSCEIFKESIKAALRAGRTPTFAYLTSRRTELKNWSEPYSDMILNVLKKRGEIITKEGKKSTQYYLPKGL